MMKIISIFISCLKVALILCIVSSCTKTSVNSLSTGNDNHGGGNIEYDSIYPLAGNWILKYSDGGTTNSHYDYPQDNNSGYGSWASHLLLLANDSAYLNSWGVDAMPVFFFTGVYTVSSDTEDHHIIQFNFTINNYSTFQYSITGKDTLQLNDMSVMPAIYTYVRE